jgi:hypothetical protein
MFNILIVTVKYVINLELSINMNKKTQKNPHTPNIKMTEKKIWNTCSAPRQKTTCCSPGKIFKEVWLNNQSQTFDAVKQEKAVTELQVKDILNRYLVEMDKIWKTKINQEGGIQWDFLSGKENKEYMWGVL